MTQAPILDHMAALSEPTRCRVLLLLEHHELTVSELCAAGVAAIRKATAGTDTT